MGRRGKKGGKGIGRLGWFSSRIADKGKSLKNLASSQDRTNRRLTQMNIARGEEIKQVEASQLFGEVQANVLLTVYQKETTGPFFIKYQGNEHQLTRKNQQWVLAKK